MTKVSDSELSTYKREVDSVRNEEIRLLVPKEVAASFREVARTLKMNPSVLFTEMVAAHASGIPLDIKS